MKVAIVSDTHFGYSWESDRGNDCFENAREAFRRTADADLVILPGDIYDHKVPKQEVLGRSIDCFNEYKQGECTLRTTEKSDVTREFTGTPVVAIHGTHERRSQGYTNPIELLDKMGYLLHLHNETVVLEHEETGEQVAVHGMSGVPERYAPGVLDKFDPEPVEDAYNIFVFHQSVENFVYTSQDHATLKLEHLPDGFDLLVDGHIHWYDLSNADSDKPLILPGSTVSTQMRKVETEKPKGFVTVDTDTDEITFHELETPRNLYHREVAVDDLSGSDIWATVEDELAAFADDNGDGKRPLVRLILTGDTDATVKLADIRNKHDDTAILSCSKQFDTGAGDITPQTFQETSKSIADMGMDLLRDKLDNDLPVEDLFDLLADEELDDAVAFVEDLNVPDTGEAEEDGDEAGKDTNREDADRDTDTAEAGEQSVQEEAAEETTTVADAPSDDADSGEQEDTGTKTLTDFS